MSLSEFAIIRKYFATLTTDDSTVQCGIGDDAAILSIPDGMDVVVSMDTLLQDHHFPPDTAPADLGYKALAVNLSDMMAMAAEPKWVLLSLSLPEPDEDWIEKFAAGFGELARQYAISLIGGDLSRGPLSVTVQIQGLLPIGTALRRSRAQRDDLIYVTGTLGDAGVALDIIREKRCIAELHKKHFLQCLNRPEINIAVGIRLRTIANSAIDISDGLLADLGHILEASQLGAEIEIEKLPLSDPMQVSVDKTAAWNYALTAGDDYQLCFTASENRHDQIMSLFNEMNIPVCCIGKTTGTGMLISRMADGTEFKPTGKSYAHF